jgi:Kdo2-lipid IVA lauroyltransferase/acyltransferase
MRIRVPNAVRDAVLGNAAVGLIKALRWTDPHRMSDFAAKVMRKVGPRLREHKTGRANLRMAYPEKSDAEIETILSGVWDNLGRLAIEFAHLDRIWDHDPDHRAASHIDFDPASEERFIQLRDDGKPALIFAAHLANWEMPALPGPAHDLPSAVVYRAPNIGAVADMVMATRGVNMGRLIKTGMDGALKAAEALQAGLHVGMLVDQYYVRGVPVTFFGRETNANPLIARLARQVDCPIFGVRVVRKPNHRFFIELTPEVPAVRDAAGKIDIQGTMQAITNVVEGWVRENPEQWLWLHRRWR